MTENDDVQLEKAHERIRELNSELVRQGDASAEIAALRKKIALSKERAQGIVNMANKRLAYLHELWSEKSQKQPTSQKQPAMDDKSDSLRSPSRTEKGVIDPRKYRAVLSRAIAMLDKISLSTTLLNDSKTESARLAKDLRQFVTSLQAAEKNLTKTNDASSSFPPTSQATSTITTTAPSVSSVKQPTGSVDASSTKAQTPPVVKATASTPVHTATSASPSARVVTAKPTSDRTSVNTAKSAPPTPAVSSEKPAPITTTPPVSTAKAAPSPTSSVSTAKSNSTKPPITPLPQQVFASPQPPPTPFPQSNPAPTSLPELPKLESKQNSSQRKSPVKAP